MRSLPAAIVLAGCACLGGLLSACTSDHDSPGPPPRLSPSIAGDPLDLSAAARQPCALLRAEQLANYRLTAPGVLTTTAAGAVCDWTPITPGLPAYRAEVDLRSGGLEALYRRRASLPVFRPTSISEYPAVNTAADLNRGHCTVEVGVADDTLLIISATIPGGATLDYTDPCDAADTFAASAIATTESAAP